MHRGASLASNRNGATRGRANGVSGSVGIPPVVPCARSELSAQRHRSLSGAEVRAPLSPAMRGPSWGSLRQRSLREATPSVGTGRPGHLSWAYAGPVPTPPRRSNRRFTAPTPGSTFPVHWEHEPHVAAGRERAAPRLIRYAPPCFRSGSRDPHGNLISHRHQTSGRHRRVSAFSKPTSRETSSPAAVMRAHVSSDRGAV